MSFNFDFIGGHLPQHPGGSSIYTGFGLNSQHPPMSTFKDNIFKDDLYLSDEDENGRKMPVRLPLFGRCPLTNKAYLDLGLQNAANKAQQQSLSLRTQENDGVTAKQSRVMGDISNLTNRIPLLQISNQMVNEMKQSGSPKKPVSWSQIAKKPINPVKPSLDDVKDTSIVALTNKHGKGKYWFKSGCPTPDPRWSSKQQLMIGPIPGDVEYATLRSAFLSKGHTIHLFIQNNQAWLEKNQEKFGKKQVKFGYVVYTDSAVSQRLLAQGYVMVGHAKVAVK